MHSTKVSRTPAALFAVLFLGLLSATTCQAGIIPCSSITGNLVSNCSFEAGSSFQGGWSDFSPIGNDFAANFGTAADGNNVAGFGDYANNPGTASQTLATVAGQSYTISVYIAEQGGNNNTAGVVFDGIPLFSMNNISNTSFQQFSYVATASSSSTVLSLVGGSDPLFVYFDNVSVVQNAPEPAAWQLLAGGLLLGAARRTWSRKK